MGASKTTTAVNVATHYNDVGYTVLFINSTKNVRNTEGGEDGKFSSHNSSNRYMNPNVHTNKLLSLSLLHDDEVVKYDVIIIDEAQFFDDLNATVRDG